MKTSQVTSPQGLKSLTNSWTGMRTRVLSRLLSSLRQLRITPGHTKGNLMAFHIPQSHSKSLSCCQRTWTSLNSWRRTRSRGKERISSSVLFAPWWLWNQWNAQDANPCSVPTALLLGEKRTTHAQRSAKATKQLSSDKCTDSFRLISSISNSNASMTVAATSAHTSQPWNINLLAEVTGWSSALKGVALD